MRFFVLMLLLCSLHVGIAEAGKLRLSNIGKGIIPRTLVAAATVGTLLALPLNANSSDQPHHHAPDNIHGWQELEHGHHDDHHLSIFYLVLHQGKGEEATLRQIPLVYLGTDPEERALMIGLRVGILNLPMAEGVAIVGSSDAWLLDNHGIVVWQNNDMELEEVEKFISPDLLEVRLHDLTLLAPHGFDALSFHAAKLASPPLQPEDPLNTIAWHVDHHIDWLADLEAGFVLGARLLQRSCVAGMPSDDGWTANSNCSIGIADPAGTSPVFDADGHLVGFNLNDGEIVTIATSVSEHIHELLTAQPHSVDAAQKLPTKWGALKQGLR